MLSPTFQINLGCQVVTDKVTVGYYDGSHPSLTCATVSGRVLIHSTSASFTTNDSAKRFLNVNQTVTALQSGSLTRKKSSNDVLFIGTENNLLGYDVENNCDLFFLEISDGVKSILIGSNPIEPHNPCVLVGGNMTISAFAENGEECFATMTGDNVTCMAWKHQDIEQEHSIEDNPTNSSFFYVGSEDNYIRLFDGEEIVREFVETDVPCCLASFADNQFGYGLVDGTVGVYRNNKRVWRIRTKNVPTSLLVYDFDNDGKEELICGWSNGKIEIRNAETGEIKNKEQFTNAICALRVADYCESYDRQKDLIVVTVDGEVCGYRLTNANAKYLKDIEEEKLSSSLTDLFQTQKNLELQLDSYKKTVQTLEKEKKKAEKLSLNAQIIRISFENTTKSLLLFIELAEKGDENEIRICGVSICGEQTKPYAISFPQTTEVRIPISTSTNSSDFLTISVLIGLKDNIHFQSIEFELFLPRFAMFTFSDISGKNEKPQSNLVFDLNEKRDRIWKWLNDCFFIPKEFYEYESQHQSFSIMFVSKKRNEPLLISYDGSQMRLFHNNIQIVGDIVQSISEHFSISLLESLSEFPFETEKLTRVLGQVEAYNSTRLKLTGEMADNTSLVKTLVVKAEDSRLLGEWDSMDSIYTMLDNINQELVVEYKKRENNQKALLEVLKEMNGIIQSFARLRIGTAKTALVSNCREAIRANDIQALFRIARTGK